jgi:PAS domain S-box-containing protein
MGRTILESRVLDGVETPESISEDKIRAEILEDFLRGRPLVAMLERFVDALTGVLEGRRGEIYLLDKSASAFALSDVASETRATFIDPVLPIEDSGVGARLIAGEHAEIGLGEVTLCHDPIRSERGEVVGAFVYMDSTADRLNISGQSRWLELAGLVIAGVAAKNELSETAALAKDFAETAFDWFWETDEDHRFAKMWGPNLGQLGRDPNYYRGKTRMEFSSNKASPQMAAHMADLDARRPFKDFVFAHRNREGITRYARVTGAPFYHGDGTFGGYRGSGADITAEEEARIIVEASHHALGRAMESAASGYMLYDSEGRLQLISDSINEMFEDDPGMFVIGEKFEDRLRQRVMSGRYVDAIGREEEYIAERLENSATRNERVIVNWGGKLWVRVEESRLPDGRLLKLVYDVTSLKERERELEEKSRLLQATLNNIEEAVSVFDQDLRLVTWNEKYMDLFGFSDSLRHVGTDLETLVLESVDLDSCSDAERLAFARDRVVTISHATRERQQLVRQVRGGRTVFIDMFPFPDNGVMAVYRDVTETQRREDALRQKEGILRAIFSSASVGIAVYSPNGTMLQVNPVFETLIGYSSDEILGRHFSRHVHPDEVEAASERFQGAVEGRVQSYTHTKRYLHKDGREIWVQGTLSALAGDDGRATMLVLLIHDITEERAAETALIEAKEEAEKVSRVKSEFLANVSHEIRTPMNSIIGFGNLLSQSDLDSRQKTFVQSIGDAASTLMGLITDVLDFSKLESGGFKIVRREFHLLSAVESTIDIARGVSENSKLPLNLDVEPLPADFYEGDAKRLQQVLLNLLSNSIKFTEMGSVTVRVTSEQTVSDDVNVTFEVIDTGIGIEESVLPGLFQPFVQADGSISRRYGGTGLGLSISKSLVELMGGVIGADSVLGEGSRFWFTIPLNAIEKGEEGQPKDESVVEEEEGDRVEKAECDILVVEDNEANSSLMLTLLQRAGHTVELAENGHQAVQIAAQREFNAILMDVQMPECDGISATREIRGGDGACKDVPIVAVTAHAMPADRQKCIDAGMDDHLTKPVSAKALSEVLARVCGSDEQ